MKILRKYAVLLALLTAITAQAQTPATPPPEPLSPSDMRERHQQIKEDIDEDHHHVLHLQALARKEKDVIKLTCINDKLVQLKAQMNLFDTASMTFESAIDTTEDSPRTVFAEIEKAGADVRKLRTEADGCAGELEMYKQESRSEVDRPELDDPTEGGPFHPPEVTGEPDLDPPGYATPFN